MRRVYHAYLILVRGNTEPIGVYVENEELGDRAVKYCDGIPVFRGNSGLVEGQKLLSKLVSVGGFGIVLMNTEDVFLSEPIIIDWPRMAHELSDRLSAALVGDRCANSSPLSPYRETVVGLNLVINVWEDNPESDDWQTRILGKEHPTPSSMTKVRYLSPSGKRVWNTEYRFYLETPYPPSVLLGMVEGVKIPQSEGILYPFNRIVISAVDSSGISEKYFNGSIGADGVFADLWEES